jgi:hypothetical protein
LRKRIVIVSHVFPPSNHQNAKRPYLMAKYLVEKSWDVTVYTTAFQTGGAQVKDLDGIHVECISSIPVSLIERLAPFPWIQERMIQLGQGLLFPDRFAPWIRKVARRLRKESYDCGILNVHPYSSFLLARECVLDSRWVIDYQEAIYPSLERRARGSILQRYLTPRLLRLERQSLRDCGKVWFTAEACQQRYVSDGAVDDSKTNWFPYFYDPDMYSGVKPSVPKSTVTILYGGSLDASWRSPRAFFGAWGAFIDKYPEASDKVRMVIYGSMDEGSSKIAEEVGIRDKIDVRNKISYRQFLREAQCSDALLYIDARDQEYFNPGKIADYFGAGRPILAFTAVGSEVDRMLRSVGMASYIADLNDVDAGVEGLVHLWRNLQKGAEQHQFSVDLYSITSICGRIESSLKELVAISAGSQT